MLAIYFQFYVSDPTQLEDERTRYQYFLQIKRDIYQGRLACPVYTLCLLASYIVQSKQKSIFGTVSHYCAQMH